MSIITLLFDMAAIRQRLGQLDRFREKEQTKSEVEVFILDKVYADLPTPPFTEADKQAAVDHVYHHVWQQALRGEAQGRHHRPGDLLFALSVGA